MAPTEALPDSEIPRSQIVLLTGPQLLGNFFAYGLMGVLCVQLWVYSYQFPKDKRGIKCLVWIVFFVDILTTVLSSIAAWDDLVKGWGDDQVLRRWDWPIGVLTSLSGFVAFCVHGFFCWRMWSLNSRVQPIFIMTISIVQWIFATYSGALGLSIGRGRSTDLDPYVITWLGGSALCDVLITIFMCRILIGKGSNAAFKHTKDAMNLLVKVTIETGMATSIVAVIELILFSKFPKNNLHYLCFLFLSKLYSNTMLATLNTRKIISDVREGHTELFVAFSGDEGRFTEPHLRASRGSVSLHSTIDQVETLRAIRTAEQGEMPSPSKRSSHTQTQTIDFELSPSETVKDRPFAHHEQS
ncbi:hypothetical protein AMATHDRAFT_61536 [Amanita thiersii Skay4041]|uniref:DUF6534 domain-containing protein n=1 Tax=Amanita thiersii Skay4041 TaxID=703135 RepID=A0A2A9NJE2_9AGAR|nr:hypothetical protein AMATHDRAFT_61536 [Amanita thiersii Skay4041]